ncbi:uncharacterized protein [Vicugna pacos]|uniref:Basic proline-rich protein-like n=1 Tax=Vicugna pacos TaxID=30538 RepID=A0ABM5E587_VICPA
MYAWGVPAGEGAEDPPPPLPSLERGRMHGAAGPPARSASAPVVPSLRRPPPPPTGSVEKGLRARSRGAGPREAAAPAAGVAAGAAAAGTAARRGPRPGCPQVSGLPPGPRPPEPCAAAAPAPPAPRTGLRRTAGRPAHRPQPRLALSPVAAPLRRPPAPPRRGHGPAGPARPQGTAAAGPRRPHAGPTTLRAGLRRFPRQRLGESCTDSARDAAGTIQATMAARGKMCQQGAGMRTAWCGASRETDWRCLWQIWCLPSWEATPPTCTHSWAPIELWPLPRRCLTFYSKGAARIHVKSGNSHETWPHMKRIPGDHLREAGLLLARVDLECGQQIQKRLPCDLEEPSRD